MACLILGNGARALNPGPVLCAPAGRERHDPLVGARDREQAIRDPLHRLTQPLDIGDDSCQTTPSLAQ